ncbi:MAG: hypothetical protein LBQ79_10655 [Deltaproteobacteria bacterium]|jgi:hypothetical protein|nr:hypothetical protein [Deltaproteobacteria bacterium]
MADAAVDAQEFGWVGAGQVSSAPRGLSDIRSFMATDLPKASGCLDWFLILASIAAVAGSYVMYLVHLPEYLNSDQAAEIMTAREILRQKTLFLREWYFSTEIFIVRTSLFMALWGLLTDSFLNTYRLAIVTDVVIMCAAFAYMMKRLGVDARATAFGLLVFFGIRGYNSGQNTGLGGSSYGTLCAITFIIIGYYAASRLGKVNRTDRIARYAIPVLAFLFGISSIRFLAVVLVPLIVAHVAEKIWSRMPSAWIDDRMLREILFWTVLSLAGWTITAKHVIPLGFGPADYSSTQSNGIFYILHENITEFTEEFLRCNQFYNIVTDFNLFSLNCVNSILCMAFFLACCSVFTGSAAPHLVTRRTVYMFLGMSIATGLLSLLLFQSRINMRIRYLVFFYILIGVVSAVGWADLRRNRPFVARLFMILAICFCLTNSLWNVRNIPSVVLDNLSRVAARHVPEIMASFQRYGIKRGFALFWDSEVQTILSDGSIEVFPVTGAMHPLRYLVPYSVFKNDRAGDPVAFLKIRLNLPPEIAVLPQFNLVRPEILDLAYDVDVIPDKDSDIEIYYFKSNPFTFPPDHDPKADHARDMAERKGGPQSSRAL